jgi:eukaryotic-like serine/threonine-protein kinase
MNESTAPRSQRKGLAVPAEVRARADAIFDELFDVEDDGERARLLEDRCAGAPELRSLVERLLRLAGAEDELLAERAGFLSRPLNDFGDDFDGAFDGAFDGGREARGRRVASYRILDEIGAGGMGVVYLAERADGHFEQKVALKLSQLGVESAEAVRRFERERQILSHLNHPNIGRLLDGGLTEDGKPFFAMELIDGVAIDQHCDQRRLSLRERIELFLTVADAVAYAHRNLVVHRDLKPSNILVDAQGQVKLLDFGIATLLDADGEGPERTVTVHRFVTPSHASPEQLRDEPVTTASDVYQLGLLLFELLTGRRAYDLTSRSRRQIERIVCESSAPLASQVVGTPAPVRSGRTPPTPEERAAARRTTPARLRRALSGDLDAILDTALRKEPERRYSSVDDLIADLGRYLSGKPVEARRSTLGYRASRFLARHRIAVTAAALVALSLVAGTAASWMQARQKAAEAAKAEAVKTFLVELFRAADPVASGGEEVSARTLLEQGASRLASELAGQPEIRSELEQVVGDLFFALGAYDDALTHAETRLALVRERHPGDHPDVAQALFFLGDVLREVGRYEEAEPWLRESLEMYRRLEGEEGRHVARGLSTLGQTLSDRGEYEAAVEMLERSLEIRRLAFGDTSREVAATLNNLGLALKYQGDLEGAVAPHRETLAVYQQLFAGDHPSTAWAHVNLAVLLAMRGEYRASEPHFDEGLRMLTRILGEEHPDVALVTNNCAKSLLLMGSYEEAEALFRSALEDNRSLFGERNLRVATNLSNLGLVLTEQGRWAEAIAAQEEALAMRREGLGDGHPFTALSLSYLGSALHRSGDLERAVPVHADALALAREAWSEPNAFLASILVAAAAADLDRGAEASAEALLREALAIREASLVAGDWQLAATRTLLGETLVAQDRFDEARPLLERGLDVLESDRPDGDWYVERARRALEDRPGVRTGE